MVQISIRDYFGPHKVTTAAYVQNAKALLAHVNALLATRPPGVGLRINPKTGTLVSGEKFGGWRPADCPIGAANSAHKAAEAVDLYDPDAALDAWITDEILERHALYREHPEDTPGWCHLSTRAPKSGRRTFKP
jgi:hypothetical protein